jgi:glutamyl-tRNA reductase
VMQGVRMSTAGDGKRRSGQERLNAAENKVVCIGLSHKTASVEVRERLAVQEQHWQEVQNRIAALPSVKEAAIISTCNRHEIYIVTSDTHKGIQEVTNFLSVAHGVAKRDLRASLFLLTEDDAVWHCLRVAGGLDSLVIGEGQAKNSQKKSQKSY